MFSLAAIASAAVAQDRGLASRIYDGRWRVAVETTVGKCAPSANVVVTVKDAKIVGIEGADAQPWGYVDSSNEVVGRFSQGEHVLRANGSVKGGHASGAWSANADFCGGRWTASREN
jgi:ABC-type amino acid transport substrate-binding protein